MTDDGIPEAAGFRLMWETGNGAAIVYCDGAGKIGDLVVDRRTGETVLLAKSPKQRSARAFNFTDLQHACEWLKLRNGQPHEITVVPRKGRR